MQAGCWPTWDPDQAKEAQYAGSLLILAVIVV